MGSDSVGRGGAQAGIFKDPQVSLTYRQNGKLNVWRPKALNFTRAMSWFRSPNLHLPIVHPQINTLCVFSEFSTQCSCHTDADVSLSCQGPSSSCDPWCCPECWKGSLPPPASDPSLGITEKNAEPPLPW